MKSFDPIIVTIIIIAIVIIGGIILVSLNSKGPPIPRYQATDSDRPKLEISETDFNFGQMNLNETKTREIQLKNGGLSSLILSDAVTSCDCTFVQFVIDGVESPKFSMARNPKWRGEIKPNQSALLRIVYEPRIMPVKGAVKREVVFKTNDPERPIVNIRFVAVVN